MKMWNHLIAGFCAAAFIMGGPALDADAQPAKRQERREKRREKKQERKEERKENRADRKEKRADKREELKEDRKEKRSEFREKRARRKELKEKETAGSLTEEEKAELERMKKGHEVRKARHAALKARHKEIKKTYKKRRRTARRKINQKYPNLHKHPAAVAEFKKHARRMAHLQRAKRVAKADERPKMEARVDALIVKDRARHQAWVARHKANWAAKKAAAKGAK